MIKKTETLEHSIKEDELELIPIGEMDHHSAANMRKRADELIIGNKPSRVALNLKRISFMDSSGLGFIMGRYALCEKLKCEFIIRMPSAAVLRICRLAGLDRKIRIER